MRITALSDLHGDLVEIRPCDVVCICGDIVPLHIQRNLHESIEWLRDTFLPWCESLPCDRVLWISGNHDFVLDKEYHRPQDSEQEYDDWNELNRILFRSVKVVYMNNRSYEYGGKKFYGCPYTIGPIGWANYRPESSNPFILIPVDTDIVLVHQPPSGQSGTVMQTDTYNYMVDYGSQSLTSIICNPAWDIQYVFCGHVHTGMHAGTSIGKARCYNVSIKDENYRTSYSPLEIDIW